MVPGEGRKVGPSASPGLEVAVQNLQEYCNGEGEGGRGVREGREGGRKGQTNKWRERGSQGGRKGGTGVCWLVQWLGGWPACRVREVR